MKLYLVILLLFTGDNMFAQNIDYTNYHKGIISAENEIFIRKDSIQGLKIFKKTFSDFSFVYVDDCIEAFELALYFKQDAYAMAFIKKAIENGFELKLLSLLSTGCPCNFYRNAHKVTVYEDFINKNRDYLEKYANDCYPKYVSRIDKHLLTLLIKRHVKEQLFKNYQQGLSKDMKTQWTEYGDVCNSNMAFIDSLGSSGIFLGEQNMGIYTDKLMSELKLPIKSIKDYAEHLIKAYGLGPASYVPVNSEEDYFGINPEYNIYFHNVKSFDILTKYKDKAIQQGYLHPREYASLLDNGRMKTDTIDMYLQPSLRKIANTKAINKKRQAFILPTYECDFAKHQFAHQHNLQLFFGFRNATR